MSLRPSNLPTIQEMPPPGGFRKVGPLFDDNFCPKNISKKKLYRR